MLAACANHFDVTCRQVNFLSFQRITPVDIPVNAACPPAPNFEIADAAMVLRQPGLAWQAAAAITELCVRELWPHDLDAASLLPEIRRILECKVVVLELLDDVGNDNCGPKGKLRFACGRLIRSASSLRQLRDAATRRH